MVTCQFDHWYGAISFDPEPVRMFQLNASLWQNRRHFTIWEVEMTIATGQHTVDEPEDVDAELLEWIKNAYDLAG